LSRNVQVGIYKTSILPVVLYRCKNWSLALSEKYRLRISENRVLRRTFGPKRDDVKGEWRKLHNGHFIICTDPQVSLGRSNQRMMWAGHVARMGEERNVYRVLVGKR
jgi:hypothetical protein